MGFTALIIKKLNIFFKIFNNNSFTIHFTKKTLF